MFWKKWPSRLGVKSFDDIFVVNLEKLVNKQWSGVGKWNDMI